MKKILCNIIIGLQVLMLSVGPAVAVETATIQVRATVVTPTDVVSISISPALADFGAITASLSQYRFRKPLETEELVMVTWDSIVDYEIRVFTDNGVGPVIDPTTGLPDNTADLGNPKRVGFIRSGTAADADQLPLKLWCPNFSGNKLVNNEVLNPVTGELELKGPVLGSIGAKTAYLWKGYDLDGDGVKDEPLGKPMWPGEEEEEDLVFRESVLDLDLNGDGVVATAADDFVIAVNFTLPETPPIDTDIELDNIGESASFSYVREEDTMADSVTDFEIAPLTRTLLAWNQPGLNDVRHTPEGADLGKTFPVCFGVDLVGIPDGIYDSNNNGPSPTVPPVKAGEDCKPGIIFEIFPY